MVFKYNKVKTKLIYYEITFKIFLKIQLYSNNMICLRQMISFELKQMVP